MASERMREKQEFSKDLSRWAWREFMKNTAAISEPLLPLPRNTLKHSSATADTVYRNYENALANGTQGMEGCDLIVCWVHNWPECPENLR